jgi:hypothetical protein
MGSILVILSLVFISPTKNGDYKVFVTKNKYEADLWVWETESRYEAKKQEQIWFRTTDRYNSNFSVSLVQSKYSSDLVIYYTDSKYQAGWKKEHRLKNILNIR